MLGLGEDGLSKVYTLPPDAEVQGQVIIHEVDIFRKVFFYIFIPIKNSLYFFHTEDTAKTTVYYLEGDAFVTSSFIRQGLMPCSPYTPTTAISIRTLELFRITQLCSPHVSIHSFVKTLCDLHTVPFKPYLSRQFSIAFDLYLNIRNSVDHTVQAVLLRDTVDWRLRHLCPPCTYTLIDEEKLKFSMLYTVDGNDSLKRILRREAAPPTSTETEEPVLGDSSESTDTRRAGEGVYLTREQVDEWSKEVLAELNVPNDDDDNNPCAERWRNMKTELTARMWGLFEETGLFLALCRHGFVLLLADMVRSGELYFFLFFLP